MKKLFLTISAAVIMAAPFCKAQNEQSSIVEFTVIPHLEALVNAPHAEDEKAVTFDNSILYSDLNINISDNFSFFMQNKWVTATRGEENKYFEATKYLYGKTTEFINFAYLEANVGGFTFHLGKDVMLNGIFEYDPYDYDVHPELASSFWNSFCCYQFGASATYTIPSGTHAFSVQVNSSPYNFEAPFKNGMMAYSAMWSCQYDFISARLAYNGIQHDEDNLNAFAHFASAGIQGKLGDFAFGMDYLNNVASTDYGTTLIPSVSYTSPSDKWDVKLCGLYERAAEINYTGWKAGVIGQWYPFTTDGWMKVSLTSGYDSAIEAYVASFGLNFMIKAINIKKK